MIPDINSLSTEWSASEVQPELKLWRALLTDAVRSIVLHLDAYAHLWLRPGRQVPASLEACCEALDVSPSRVRRVIATLLALPDVEHLRALIAQHHEAAMRHSHACHRGDPRAVIYRTERDRLTAEIKVARHDLEFRFGWTCKRMSGHTGNNGRLGWRKDLTPDRQSATVGES